MNIEKLKQVFDIQIVIQRYFNENCEIPLPVEFFLCEIPLPSIYMFLRNSTTQMMFFICFLRNSTTQINCWVDYIGFLRNSTTLFNLFLRYKYQLFTDCEIPLPNIFSFLRNSTTQIAKFHYLFLRNSTTHVLSSNPLI